MRRTSLTLASLGVGAVPAWAQGAPGAAGPPAPVPAPPSAMPDWVTAWIPAWLRQDGFLLQHWQWLGLLAVVIVAVLVDRVVAFIARRVVGRTVGWATRLGAAVTDEDQAALQRSAGRPFGFMAGAALAWLLLPALALPAASGRFLVNTAEVLLAVGFVWAAYRCVDVGAIYLGALARRTETRLDDMLVPLVRRTAKIFVLAIGVVFVAQNQGLEVSSLIAGLGIGGLAFALAAKDTIANVFGSITVITDHPFEIGDWVVVAGAEGTVERVGFRSTRIRTFYDSLITVPNAKLIDNVVDNYGRRRHRRYSTKFGIAYDTPVWKVEAFCEGLRELVRRHPQTRKDGWHVYFNDLGESALLIMVYVFFTVPDWAAELQARHAFLASALRLAEALGVEYAFPTRTLHVAGVPPVSADAPGHVPPLPGPTAPADADGALALGRELAAQVSPTGA